jgi:3-isopropylmalate dehydrogenase
MRAQIAVLAGDGIGPEVTNEAVRVLQAAAACFGHQLEFRPGLIGWAAIDGEGVALPASTVELCRNSRAILLGAVGLPVRDGTLPPNQRPEVSALLALRRGLYANLRPVALHPALAARSPLKSEVIAGGVDMLIVRELNGGLYYGQPKGRSGDSAVDTMAYSAPEIERIAVVAFEAARLRRKQVCSVDKANVLATSQLWREVVIRVAARYPDVELRHQYVDACAMQLVQNPRQFDVIVTENTFGDILSDEAAVLAGSLGMLPSASLGASATAGKSATPGEGATPLFEPVHGSAPDIAGKGIANPLGAILSGAMLLRYALRLEAEALAVERAAGAALSAGLRTADLCLPGERPLSTMEMGAAIVARLQAAA